MQPLTVLLATPRGFCAGVRRAIRAVADVRAATDRPVYVRHEIVHNRRVVDSLRDTGVMFVEELSEVPDGSVAVVSAHGAARSVYSEAARRRLPLVDATCPLVRRVHLEAQRHVRAGRFLVIIGHSHHVEVVGILGQVDGSVAVVSAVNDVGAVAVTDPERIAYVTQTTLSVTDAREIIDALKDRFPAIVGPDTRTICYATQNRQAALRAVAARAERLVVCGSRASSNTNRLRELGQIVRRPTLLIEEAGDLPREFIDGVGVLGMTAGASTPESIIEETLARLSQWRDLTVEEVGGADERVAFAPAELSPLTEFARAATP